MRHLVVLGAGDDQLATYAAAERRGLATIGVDMRADAPGATVADRFLHITTRDPDAIAAALGELPVAGVIAPAGDVAQPTVRALALRFGLGPIVSELAARCSCDKGAFRMVVAQLGLPTYRTEQHADDASLARAAARIGYPVMVKPSDSSGSKGVSFVADPSALPTAIAAARQFTLTGQVIVEEYVQGRHFSAECFLARGELALFVLSERTTTGPPGMITVTHRVPAALGADEHDAIRRMVATVADGIGLRDGPLNVDLVVAHDGTPYLIEMGSRLGGNGMPQLVWLAHGVDTVAAAVDHACGEPFDVRPRFTRAAMLHILHTWRSGTLQRIRGLEAIDRSPEVVTHELFVAPGDEVRPYVKAANKLGYVLMASDCPADLDARLRLIERAFWVDLDQADHEHHERGALSCEHW